LIPDEDLQARLHQNWTKSQPKKAGAVLDDAAPGARWQELKQRVGKLISTQSRAKRFGNGLNELKSCIHRIILLFTYPRLDINVSKHRNHLLKSPWAVHPKTGRVCVPFDAEKADEFNPETVPTIAALCKQIDEWKDDTGDAGDAAAGAGEDEGAGGEEGAGGGDGEEDKEMGEAKRRKVRMNDSDKTEMKGYLEFFEESFLRPLYADIRAKNKEAARNILDF
jgi:hypothetical protein